MKPHTLRYFLSLFLVVASSTCLAQLSMRDDLNRPLLVKKAATRVVSLAPFLTEAVYAAGAGDLLVGVDAQSTFPREAQALPKVATGAAFSVDQLAALRPDLVLAWKDGIRREDVDRISAFGAHVFVAQARQLEDVPRLLRTVAALTGRNADPAVNEFHSKLESLRRANAFKSRLQTFLEIWHRPITTVSGDHFLSEALDICRAENIFEELRGIAPKVTYEEIAERNPYLILGAGSAASAEEFRANWQLRPALRAVQAHRLLYVDVDTIQRPTPRTPEGIAVLCEALDQVRAAPNGVLPAPVVATQPAPAAGSPDLAPSLQLSPFVPRPGTLAPLPSTPSPAAPSTPAPAPAERPDAPAAAPPAAPQPPAAPEPEPARKRPSQYGM